MRWSCGYFCCLRLRLSMRWSCGYFCCLRLRLSAYCVLFGHTEDGMCFFGRDIVVDLVSRVCFVLVAVDTRHWLVVLCACAKLCELVFGLSSCQDVVVFRVLGYSSIKECKKAVQWWRLS